MLSMTRKAGLQYPVPSIFQSVELETNMATNSIVFQVRMCFSIYSQCKLLSLRLIFICLQSGSAVGLWPRFPSISGQRKRGWFVCFKQGWSEAGLSQVCEFVALKLTFQLKTATFFLSSIHITPFFTCSFAFFHLSTYFISFQHVLWQWPSQSELWRRRAEGNDEGRHSSTGGWATTSKLCSWFITRSQPRTGLTPCFRPYKVEWTVCRTLSRRATESQALPETGARWACYGTWLTSRLTTSLTRVCSHQMCFRISRFTHSNVLLRISLTGWF